MLWLTMLALALTGVNDVPNPRSQNSWVSDTAAVLSPEAVSRIDTLLDALHRDTDAEFAVVTVNDIAGEAKPFATELFNLWGIGDARTNNGVLVLLVMGQRRLEIEVGYGLETQLPDGWLGLMQARTMVPRFKQGDFAAGLEAGLLEIDAKLRGQTVSEAALPKASSLNRRSARSRSTATRPSKGDSGGLSWYWWLAICLAPIAPLWFLWRWVRIRHHRRCRTCKIDRYLLDEKADDKYLESGQVTEERLGSVDYRVYVCGQCSSMSIMPDRAWFSGYSKCRKCRYRTMTVSSTTISAATYDSSGTGQSTEDCKHCGHHATRTYTIPRLTRPSSTSSSSSYSSSSSGGSSGSSYGGGSSGGGGAGSSW